MNFKILVIVKINKNTKANEGEILFRGLSDFESMWNTILLPGQWTNSKAEIWGENIWNPELDYRVAETSIDPNYLKQEIMKGELSMCIKEKQNRT